jgi:hypothetical protein
MKYISVIPKLILLITFFYSTIYCQSDCTNTCDKNCDSKVIYAGVRSSSYGIKPFPTEKEWANALKKMSSYYPGSTPTAIWIVGVMGKDNSSKLSFPSDGKEYKNIIFDEIDKHEPFLNYFDKAGIKVFLQVESANADMCTLMDLVLNRYKHHPCVIGFGVDVEWYCVSEKPNSGVEITDETAELWEKKVKSFNPNYRLFLKHWDHKWMPPKYRGDILFVTDSQGHADLNAMVDEFSNSWANFFKPNPVGFQIGYKEDKKIWEKFSNPPRELGKLIVEKVKQNCGVFWVDFSLRDVNLLSE